MGGWVPYKDDESESLLSGFYERRANSGPGFEGVDVGDTTWATGFSV